MALIAYLLQRDVQMITFTTHTTDLKFAQFAIGSPVHDIDMNETLPNL
jgi:hypothetical protein